jgi:hypothetical protein
MILVFNRIVMLSVGIIFLLSGYAHIENPYYYLYSIYAYEIVGANLGKVIAEILPFLQVSISVCLLAGVFSRGALISAAGLLLTYTFVQYSGISRGLTISCGCFGTYGSGLLGTASLATVVVLFCVVVLAIVAQHTAALDDRYRNA